jgi:hypothetical protein
MKNFIQLKNIDGDEIIIDINSILVILKPNIFGVNNKLQNPVIWFIGLNVVIPMTELKKLEEAIAKTNLVM